MLSLLHISATLETPDFPSITILNLSQKELKVFSESNMMIAKDLLRYDETKIARMTGISKKRISNMQKLIEQIFHSR